MIAQDQQSRVFYELCALLLSILRPPPLSVSVSPPPSPATAPPRRSEISPSALASLLLGVSMALMLCGSVTFVIGFILMPWVLGLVMIFYFFGLVSNLSGLGNAILLGNNSTGSERNEMPGKLLSKLPIP
ncbi:hypothetical protein MRB53_001943 [Persea americana]|uniref:Uncharacterized protein n=1 Tax=Persea americana TaxID=3435 RepID=A0ACC2MU12_PERAE|nr:hypothetical protein MRB53_001943 [Persea americana]